MMNHLVKYLGFIVTMLMIRKSLPDLAPSYCTQTAGNSLEATPRKIMPVQINGTDWFQKAVDNVAKPIHLTLCPDKNILKISWSLPRPQAMNLTLCYKVQLTTYCFMLTVHQSEYSTLIDCWFPSYYTEDTASISAWTGYEDQTQVHTLYGQLDTTKIDSDNTCDDVCELSKLRINTPVSCRATSRINHDPGVSVHNLVFDSKQNSDCSNDSLEILLQQNNVIEYNLKCAYQGEGYIKVLFSVKGRYCIKYQRVSVTCTQDLDEEIQRKMEDAHSFGAFMIFGVICMVVITLIVVTIIIAAQRLAEPYRKYCKPLFQHCRRGASGINNIGEEHIPLRVNTAAENTQSVAGPSILTPNSRTKANMEKFNNDQASSQDIYEAWKLKYGKHIRKSITMAVLEDLDPLYKKRILFLPIPFDHFSRDVTNILKRVFTKEGGMFTQCCFDRDVYSKYMTGDRYMWTEHLLGDHDKILIFLCFTSLTSEIKHDPLVRNILNNLLLSRVKSLRLCQVVFLHLLDNSDNIQRNYSGEHFHISSEYDYFKFVDHVLGYCGRNSDDHSELKLKISSSKASKHFLHFIGINKKVS